MHITKITLISNHNLAPDREAFAPHLPGHTRTTNPIPLGGAVRQPLLCAGHPRRRNCNVIHPKRLPGYTPCDCGSQYRITHGAQRHGPDRCGSQLRPSGNGPRHTTTPRGCRSCRPRVGLQDHHPPPPLALVHLLLGSPFLTPIDAWNLITARSASLGLECRVTPLLHWLWAHKSAQTGTVGALYNVDLAGAPRLE